MKKVIGGLVLAFVLLPLLVIQVMPTHEPQTYVFQARIQQKLDETLGGQLQYFLMEQRSGDAPAPEFVICISQSYTRGYDTVKLERNTEFWGDGDLMTPEVFYGEQYLFFGRPQIYVQQIKGTFLWPDQITALKTLYLAPLTRLVVPVYVITYPFMEEFTLVNYLTIIVQTVVLATTILLGIKKRKDPRTLAAIVIGYAVVTMIVTIPMLATLY